MFERTYPSDDQPRTIDGLWDHRNPDLASIARADVGSVDQRNALRHYIGHKLEAAISNGEQAVRAVIDAELLDLAHARGADAYAAVIRELNLHGDAPLRRLLTLWRIAERDADLSRAKNNAAAGHGPFGNRGDNCLLGELDNTIPTQRDGHSTDTDRSVTNEQRRSA